MNVAVIKERASALFSEASFLHHINNEEDYNAALALMDELIEDYEASKPLIQMLESAIEHWEDSAEEFAGFNARIAELDSGVEVLKVLMEQNHLKGSDLPEIGSPSLVSKILNGKGRQLTKAHIEALSRRFNVSPAIFF